jgi:DNA-binding NtrC family response regulator
MLFPVLIISEDPEHRETLGSITSSCGLRPVGWGTLSAAQYLLSHQGFTAILYEVPEPKDVRATIKQLAHSASETPIVLVSRIDDWDSYLVAIAAGAFDYIDFPPCPGELQRILCLALNECTSARTAIAKRT